MRVTAYGLLAAIDVALAAAGGRARTLRRLSKPVLMPALVGRMWLTKSPARRNDSVPGRGAATTGVALSGVGDVALLGRSDSAFMVGLGAFLAGHVSYAKGFADAGGWNGVRGEPWRALPAAALGAVGAAAIVPTAGDLAVPVAGYIGVISTMAALAFGTGNRTTMAGAGLFCLSDLILGLAKFRGSGQTPGQGQTPGLVDALVMATYTAGQHLIVRGLTGR